MAKELINFNLTGDLAERLLFIEKRYQKPGAVPPTRAVIVKALMGYDPNQLLQGGEREYFGSGRIDALAAEGKDHSKPAVRPTVRAGHK